MTRVLYVTHRVPWPPNRGDRIRTWNIIRYLSRRCELHVVSLADEPPEPGAAAELEKYCESVTIARIGSERWLHAAISFLTGRTLTEGLFRSSAASVAIRRLATEPFDAVLASSSGVAAYLDEIGPGPRRWVDLIDVDSQKWFDYADASGLLTRQVYRREAMRLRRLEQQLARRCDRLLVVSEAEVDVFRTFSSDGDVRTVTNGVDLEFFDRPGDHAEQQKCVFVGVLSYKPNVDGVVWFVNEVWPAVRERYPHAVFEIVGKDPAPEVRGLNAVPGVKVVGPVPDVRPWLWSAAVVVTPLLIARGVQNKVLEAFAAGRAVVSTSPPLVGLDLVRDRHAALADSPEQWVQSIDRLFNDESARKEMGAAARQWVSEHHRWDVCLQELDELIRPEPAGRELPAQSAAEAHA